ncbi:MAG TPA: penicillin-binding protein 2 [Candidatus Saccharimonadales bacterium]|nr:penicillin-binding protein 2 [Candidatus Saccharimonadales bacterium]
MVFNNGQGHTAGPAAQRVRAWYGLILVVIGIFAVRLFYIQVIRYDHYKAAALSDQLKQYSIPATRGTIGAHDAAGVVPIVLNQKLYTLFADPLYIKNPEKVAVAIQGIVGGDSSKYLKALQQKGTRYVVLGKRLSEAQKAKISALKYAGVGLIEQDYRTYPQGALAAQLLGFVNDDSKGVYGVEQALDPKLKGTPGQLKAITDSNGVPLAASRNNVEKPAVAGSNLVLTIDLALQQQLETILKEGAERARAESASALIIDPNSGAIRAMANFPTYDPSEYYKVDDPKIFNNSAVSEPIEVGSTMKTLTTAAALDQGVINANTTYYDPARWKIDGFTITNIEEDGGAGTRSIAQLLNLSLNTGATWELMQMGGGEINTKARNAWYDYLVNRYMLGKATGIEQGYEASGYVPKPADNGAGIDLTYANTAFGQALTVTPLQMAAALSAILNGGTYYQPRLMDQIIGPDDKITTEKSVVVKSRVVKPEVGQAMIPLMQYVVDHHSIVPPFDQSKYIVGGKTGTAQIAKPGGGYHTDEYNGTYVGFVGGNQVDYVIVVFVHKPKIGGYAGSAAAQPIFGRLAHLLIDQSYVKPKH